MEYLKVKKQPVLLCPDINYVWGLSKWQNEWKTIGIIELDSDKFILAVETFIEKFPNNDTYFFKALGREYKPRIYKSRKEAEQAWNDKKMSFHVCNRGKYGLEIEIKR